MLGPGIDSNTNFVFGAGVAVVSEGYLTEEELGV
jgi:hypothetical protein